MVFLPVDDITDYPDVLAGKSNGQLPLGILLNTPGLAGGPNVLLVTPTARAWRAMSWDALTDANITLQSTSAADSYRPLAVQTAIFFQRYTPTWHGGWATRTCNGKVYYQIPGTASAACPGTSNHGLGLAVDVANASGARLNWLLANAQKYGFSWEIQSEPWHIRYVSGDHIPAAVLAYERDDVAITQTDADLIAQTMVTKWLGASGPNAGVAWQTTYGTVQQMAPVIQQIAADVQALPTEVEVELTDEQLDIIANKVAAKLTALQFVATPVDPEL